ncbi:MAG TPA: hypothetical protein DIT74_07015 [Pseudoalteromonas sp.]|nr:hypothetical protein [Pseudoalteromonas sp.]
MLIIEAHVLRTFSRKISESVLDKTVMFQGEFVSHYEIISTSIALIAVCISFMAIVRTRKLSEKQLAFEKTNAKLSALAILVSEYKSEAESIRVALSDGTIEIENLSRIGMENALDEVLDKQYKAVEDIEKILIAHQATER